MAAHSRICACLACWPHVLANTQNCIAGELARSIPAHGGLLLAVLLDACAINQISLVNWTQWFVVIFPLDFICVIWTVIHALSEIGNPAASDTDPLTNDDAICPGMIEWSQTKWKQTLAFAFIVLFAVSPLVFLFLKRIALCLSKLECLLDCRQQDKISPPTQDTQSSDMSTGTKMLDLSFASSNIEASLGQPEDTKK